ncbi:MAG: rhodanese-related sulfurtransferase [Thermodesulfobacteriota bacterium]
MKEKVVIAVFYKFIRIDDFRSLGEKLHCKSIQNQISGTFILAEEGINAAISGSREGVQKIIDFLNSDKRFSGIDYKFNYDDKNPFHRMKIKFKKEIVPIGLKGIDPERIVGRYVAPTEWNDLITDSDVFLIDTRNDYEYEVGTFSGAVNPGTKHFREFPDFVTKNLDPSKHKKVAMFCTGGIRCEKATSFLLENGFDEVYHLKGGILKYLEEVPKEKSLWKGECFVFDDRTSVDHSLKNGSYEMCRNCRYPLSSKDRLSEKYREGISCGHCYDRLTEERISALEERQKQIRLAKMRNQKHLGSVIYRQK